MQTVVGVEVRRQPDSGVGRVAGLYAEWLAQNSRFEVVAVGPPELTAGLRVQRTANWRALPFSQEDLRGLAEVVDEQKIDCFMATQFYTSPFLACKQIRVIHDLWPLQRPDLLPELPELTAHFGATNLDNLLETTQMCVPRDQSHSQRRSLLVEALDKWHHLVLRRAAAVVTPSQFVADAVRNAFPEVKPRITAVHPVQNVLNQQRPWAAPGVRVQPPYLLHVAALEPRKGHADLLTAMDIVRESFGNISLVAVGRPSGVWREYSRRLERTLREKEDQGWMLWLGEVTDRQLVALYKGASAVVVPSLDEGFGLPALEAMQLQRPLVVTTAGALPEVCGPGAYYCEPGRPNSLAEAISRCLRDGDLRVLRDLQRAQVVDLATAKPALRLQNLVSEVLTADFLRQRE